MINKALELAAAGFRIFPLAPGTKVPVKGTRGLSGATMDAKQVTEWWTRWPSANIGLSPSPDWIVFDLDSKHGTQLSESTDKLMSLGLPSTLTIITPSGGVHLYFRWTPQGGRAVKSTVGGAWGFPGVDIRADGGYVVAPGSHTIKSAKSSEGYYTVAEHLTKIDGYTFSQYAGNAAVLPQVILDILPYKPGPQSATISSKNRSGMDPVPSFLKGLPKSATDAVPQTPTSLVLPEVIPVGERDSILFGYIGKLISQGLSKDEIIIKTKEAFKRCQQIPGDMFLWETAEAQIERALGLYRQDQFVPPATPDIPLIPEAVTLDAALQRYCLIESGQYVADLSVSRRSEPVKWGDFKLARSNIMVSVGDGAVKRLPDAWINHKRRKIVHGITYYPKDIPIMHIDNVTYFNRYVPSALKSTKNFDPKKIEIARSHIYYLLGNNDIDMVIMEKWLAYTIKRPEMKIPWAPLIITTEQGTGKGWVKDLLKMMVGQTNFGLATPEMLTSNQIQFNGWIGGTLLVLDELKGVDATLLNHVVTENYGTVNPKYQPKETRHFFCNVIGFSNNLNALKISLKDRRWWIINYLIVPQTATYYTKLYNWLSSDGVQHYYTYLWTIDTSSSDFMARPPLTQAKLRMIDETAAEAIRLVQDIYDLSQGPFEYDIVSTDLIIDYIRGEVSIDTKLNERQIGRYINTHLRKCLLPRSEQKYTVTIGDKTYRKRLIVIRNPQIWKDASEAEVIAHYAKHHGDIIR